MDWYKLICTDCKVEFSPLRSDTLGELLCTDYDAVPMGGEANKAALIEFHRVHSGHTLEEEKVIE
jgi:hypothetical protein